MNSCKKMSASNLKNGLKQFVLDNKKELSAAVAMAVLIFASGLYFGCKIWQMIPLFVSTLGVMTLQMKANRYMFLLGGFNATIGYTAVYLSQGLYATAAYSFLCSGPVQLITFALWQKRAYKHSAKLKKMTKKQIFWMIAGSIAAWLAMFVIFSLLGSPYLVLDNTVSLVGILSTILSMLSYLEYTIVSLLCSLASIFLYVEVIIDQPDQIPHLIYTIYCAITTWISFRYMQRLYREQQEEDVNE